MTDRVLTPEEARTLYAEVIALRERADSDRRTEATNRKNYERLRAERDLLRTQLDAVCDAYEAWDHAVNHGPGSGISDPDYPGPHEDELKVHDEEVGSLWYAIGDTISAARAAVDAFEQAEKTLKAALAEGAEP
ncbi:MAG TPA: hypothetical protein VN903_28610 [Polyangia bacterium]|nr:hypothetical protein [Polyangia bacterium]